MECWSVGVMEYWSIGAGGLEWWKDGMMLDTEVRNAWGVALGVKHPYHRTKADGH